MHQADAARKSKHKTPPSARRIFGQLSLVSMRVSHRRIETQAPTGITLAARVIAFPRQPVSNVWSAKCDLRERHVRARFHRHAFLVYP
jgi:hypothetical protein